jgi:hypothetical protein
MPTLRVFATYAIWSDRPERPATAIQEGGNVGGFSPAPYAHSNQGWLLGAQAEWYFEFGQTVLGSKKASHCQLPSVCFKSKIHFVRA